MRCVKVKETVLSLAVAAAMAGTASQAHASAFGLMEQSASGLGNSYAGAAATADDASTIYYNPAGMSLLPAGSQISVGVTAIGASAKFGESSSTGPFGTVPLGTIPLGGNGGDAGSVTPVPNFYFATDIAKDWKVGLGISVPFGLKTEYSSDWVGRFQAIKSDIETLNLNPTISYKVNDAVSLGLGLSYQHIDADFSSAVDYQALAFPVLGLGALALAPAEGIVDTKGKDDAWGVNVGAMFQLSPDTRLGVSYRSSIKYTTTGTVTFTNVPAALAGNPAIANGNVSVDIKMPDSASVALRHRLDSKWILLGDVTWTGWSKIQTFTIVRDNGTILSSTPENFRDTYRVAVGANYRYSDAWTIKMGASYEQTPVNDIDRTPRLPDQDRYGLSVGGRYRWSEQGTLDIGYVHLFLKDTPINQNAGNANVYGQLTGTYQSSADIVGVQYAYQF